ncbi:ABC transporter permease [Streptomyces misionensis]|uniref:ABC transporter permease n=1 Tax=Streptomyces misionensis TaxID=67331 RepID=UPI00396B755C
MAVLTAPALRTKAPAVLRNRAVGKLLLLALVTAVLLPVLHGRAWPHHLTVSLTKPLTDASGWIIDNRDTHPLFLYFFGYVSEAVVLSVRAVYVTLLAIGWPGVTVLGALVAWRVAGPRLATGTAVAFLACGVLGMWEPTMQTLALMVVAVLASVLVGVVLGLAGGLSERLDRALRPVLDTMQVLPAFAYLLPVVLVFGIGVPAAVLATVVYAAPPMARLTALGLRGADPEVLEAVESLGATRRQRLLTARVPLARKELLLGLNQTIMMALSMAVIASVIGAGALDWPNGWSLDIAQPVNHAVDWMTSHLYSGVPVVGGTADWAGHFTTWVLDPIRDGLQWLPWWSVLLIVAALAWLIGTWRTALTAVLAMAAIGVLGVWEPSLDTLSQVLAAVAVTLVLGIATGIAAARSDRVERALRPVLDVFQTMPQFVYLIPVVALFGVGRAPAVAAAVVYALPAVVRITAQGLRQVDPAALESARSLGATGRQQLWQVQLPLARRALLLAVNQGVVLVLAVVIIGGLVGGGALGYDVAYGLAQGDLATGLVAGAAIVCLGLMLDRVTQPTERRAGKGA